MRAHHVLSYHLIQVPWVILLCIGSILRASLLRRYGGFPLDVWGDDQGQCLDIDQGERLSLPPHLHQTPTLQVISRSLLNTVHQHQIVVQNCISALLVKSILDFF